MTTTWIPCPACEEAVEVRVEDDADLAALALACTAALNIHFDTHQPESANVVRLMMRTGYSEHHGQCAHDGRRTVTVHLDVITEGRHQLLEMDYGALVDLHRITGDTIQVCQTIAREHGAHLC